MAISSFLLQQNDRHIVFPAMPDSLFDQTLSDHIQIICIMFNKGSNFIAAHHPVQAIRTHSGFFQQLVAT